MMTHSSSPALFDKAGHEDHNMDFFNQSMWSLLSHSDELKLDCLVRQVKWEQTRKKYFILRFHVKVGSE